MKLKITLKTYEKIVKEVEKEKFYFGYSYFRDTLHALSKCIDIKRDFKHSISEIRIERRTLYKIILFINDEKHLVKLTSKMRNYLFPKEIKKIEKKYKEPKDTSSLFV
ncbi:MAG: hypothetical protein ACTJGM_09340 [Fusobacterium sp.]